MGILLHNSGLFATTVIAVRTPQEVVIATDSMVSGGNDFGVKGEVCKIRVVGTTVFASAGFVANLPLQVDVYRMADETLAASASVRVNAERFANRFLIDMGQVVRWAKEHDAAAWAEYQRGACFEAVFAGIEEGVPVLLRQTYACAADFQGRAFVIQERSTACPGDCNPGGLRYVSLGAARAVLPPIQFWSEFENPAGAARFLVEEQVHENPDRVGGPVSVVQVTRGGIACVQCSASCADTQRVRTSATIVP